MTTEQKQQEIIRIARSYLGVPYHWGVNASDIPNSFDCAAFVQYIFKTVGVALSRSTIHQALEGQTVALENIEPGDAVFVRGFFGHYSPYFPDGVGHTGIYIGNGIIIHAARERLAEPLRIEVGGVVESNLDEYIQAWGLVTIQRYI